MATINQLVRKPRVKQVAKSNVPAAVALLQLDAQRLELARGLLPELVQPGCDDLSRTRHLAPAGVYGVPHAHYV